MEKINLNLLSDPLLAKDIEFRVDRIWEKNWKWWAMLLVYKDARCDMNRLDEVVWQLNWKREHTRDNKNCIVSIYDTEKKEWISKEDVWAESFSAKEKWLASDSFKRACFNWGIGRELYDYPTIFISLNNDEWYIDNWKVKASPKLLKDWVWGNEFDEKWLKKLAAKDSKWELRFNYTRK